MFSLIKRNYDDIIPRENSFSVLDSFFENIEKDFFNKPSYFNEDFFNNVPNFRLTKGKNEDILEMKIPGLKKEDLNVSIEEENIAISGETKEKDKSSFSYLKFARKFPLARGTYDTEKIEAKLEDGILNLKLPLNKKRKVHKKIIDVK